MTSKEVAETKPRCRRMKLNLEGEHFQCERTVGVNCDGYCRWCFKEMKQQLPAYRRKVAEKEIEREGVRLLHELVEKNGVQVEVREFDESFDPLQALLEVAHEQLIWKQVCMAKLAKLQEDEWRWDGDRAGEQIRSEITVYERAIERATNTLLKIGRLGIEERLTRVAERQVAIIETAIVRTLQELDLSVDIQAKARTRIIKHLKSA